jgi:F-type H+-transporting ATPase subunit b
LSLKVKRRLDYQMEVGGVQRRVEQKHMVDWIIKSVKQSITAKQEEEALRKCVADLKALKA